MFQNEIKVLLTIYLEGGKLTRESSKIYIPYSLKAKELFKNLVKDKEGNLVCLLPKDQAEQIEKKGVRWHYPLKQNTVYKKVKISQYQFDFFTNVKEVFGGKFDNLPIRLKIAHIARWKEMSIDQRLEWHFDLIANGNPFEYELID